MLLKQCRFIVAKVMASGNFSRNEWPRYLVILDVKGRGRGNEAMEMSGMMKQLMILLVMTKGCNSWRFRI